jgi:hypothetical protein
LILTNILNQRSIHPLPAFTLDIFGARIYVINSAELVTAVQRNHKRISVDPFLTTSASREAGIKGDDLKLLEMKDLGGGGLNTKILDAMHSTLLGPGLNDLTRKMTESLTSSIDELASYQGQSFDLHAWSRHVITLASTCAAYGPQNPYNSSIIEKSLW